MIYPSADKLNKVGSKYKLIAMAATRYKQLKSGMKPLIETDSTNYLTIAFEEIAAGVITADIEDVEELSIDYSEMTRTYSEFKDEDGGGLDKIIEDTLAKNNTEENTEVSMAESIKKQASTYDDLSDEVNEIVGELENNEKNINGDEL